MRPIDFSKIKTRIRQALSFKRRRISWRRISDSPFTAIHFCDDIFGARDFDQVSPACSMLGCERPLGWRQIFLAATGSQVIVKEHFLAVTLATRDTYGATSHPTFQILLHPSRPHGKMRTGFVFVPPWRFACVSPFSSPWCSPP